MIKFASVLWIKINTMKKTLLLFFSILCFELSAKTTYIPTYDNRLVIIENGVMDTLINQQRILEKNSSDGLVTIAIVQQVVTPELIKSIKQTKRAAVWAMVAAGLSSASAGMAQGQMNYGYMRGNAVANYVNAHENAESAIQLSQEAREASEELKTLVLDLDVQNNSEKEMLITDMDRGLVWFILPHRHMLIPLAKDEECHFRISSCNPLDENVKYINALGTSTLEKYNVGFESDLFWYVPISEKAKKGLRFETEESDGYIKIDKESMRMQWLSPTDYKETKQNQKSSEE